MTVCHAGDNEAFNPKSNGETVQKVLTAIEEGFAKLSLLNRRDYIVSSTASSQEQG